MDLIIGILVILTYLLFKYSRKNFNHWKIRGVPYIKPKPFVGNFWKVITLQTQIGNLIEDFCKQFNHPYFGIFFFNKPILVVKSLEIIKDILVKEYGCFSERTIVSHKRTGSVQSKYLFVVGNPEWKCTRARLAPAFSTGKLKNMINTINKVCEDLKDCIRKNLDKDSIHARELCHRYATDVMASVGYGIEAHSFKTENSEFCSIAKLVFGTGIKTSLVQNLYFLYPRLVQFLKLPFFPVPFTSFLERIFWDAYNERKESGYKRNDVIDLIIHLKEKSKPGDEFEFDDDRMAALAGQFSAAGFDTISSITSFTLYELSLQPDLQEKLRQEIHSVIKEHGSISYQAIEAMKYMNMVLNETLRMYPVLPFLERKCVKEYKIPNSDFKIEEGTSLFISTFGLHYNPDFYPDPKKFNPERFSEENKDRIPEYAFIPFGKGPKSCIGARLGYLCCKVCLAHILSEFAVQNTSASLDFEKKGFIIVPKCGIPLKFKKLQI